MLPKGILHTDEHVDAPGRLEAQAMRALAHPVRIAVLELARESGTITATECSREVGESPQACSYHLRALAKWGFLREAPGIDRRESRWALATPTIVFQSAGSSEAADGAATLLKLSVLERDAQVANEYLAREHELEPEWRDAASFTRLVVSASAAQIEALEADVHALVRRHTSRAPTHETPETRRVDITFRAVPRPGNS